jgi:hypothetical protein
VAITKGTSPRGAQSPDVRKSDEIRFEIARTEKQIAKTKAAFDAQEDPKQAITLGTMLTNLDTKRAQLIKDLELETTKEKGTIAFTKTRFDYIKSLFGKEKKINDPDTRREIQEALRTSIERITIDVKDQSYTIAWKNSENVFAVKLTKTGYKVTGEGCVNFEKIEFD